MITRRSFIGKGMAAIAVLSGMVLYKIDRAELASGQARPQRSFVKPEPAKPAEIVRIEPARERIDSANNRPVGMHAAAFRREENARAIVLVAAAQNGAACLGMLRDEVRRRHTETPRQPQDFVRADADSLVVTAA